MWTDPGGLAWLEASPDRPSLKMALADCASTLSHRGTRPALSTDSVDQMLARLDAGANEIAHGNLWVLTLIDGQVEVRMDVDEPSSDPLDAVEASTLARGLEALRAEVLNQLADGHSLDDRYWSQQNPD